MGALSQLEDFAKIMEAYKECRGLVYNDPIIDNPTTQHLFTILEEAYQKLPQQASDEFVDAPAQMSIDRFNDWTEHN